MAPWELIDRPFGQLKTGCPDISRDRLFPVVIPNDHVDDDPGIGQRVACDPIVNGPILDIGDRLLERVGNRDIDFVLKVSLFQGIGNPVGLSLYNKETLDIGMRGKHVLRNRLPDSRIFSVAPPLIGELDPWAILSEPPLPTGRTQRYALAS